MRHAFALSALLLSGACQEQRATLPVLTADSNVRATLNASGDWTARWRVTIPENWIAVHAHLATQDLPVSLSWIPPDGHEPAGDSRIEGGLGWLALDRFSMPAIASGDWTLLVRYEGPVPPQTGARMLEALPVELSMESFATGNERELRAGTALAVEPAELDSGTHGFWFEVPPGTARARVDIHDTQIDWSLYARHGASVGKLDAHLATRATPLGAETLILGDDEPLPEGRWHLDCVDADLSGDGSGFSILLSFDERPPQQLAQPLPRLEHPQDPFQAAIASVVEVATEDSVGSGTLVSPQGWVLTNAHVVGGADEAVISVTLEPALPPIESYRARVEWRDLELDLALLRIHSGYYGQDLPEDYRFPCATLGDPEQVLEGDALWMVGYPRTGGSQNRVPRHLTHGVLSGLEAYAGLVRMKSDAAIYLGNSGGAILDAEARFVAVPTSMVEFSSGQTAFLHPWTWIPPEWQTKAGLRR
jgi:S1-C subfamily serine protease